MVDSVVDSVVGSVVGMMCVDSVVSPPYHIDIGQTTGPQPPNQATMSTFQLARSVGHRLRSLSLCHIATQKCPESMKSSA